MSVYLIAVPSLRLTAEMLHTTALPHFQMVGVALAMQENTGITSELDVVLSLSTSTKTRRLFNTSKKLCLALSLVPLKLGSLVSICITTERKRLWRVGWIVGFKQSLWDRIWHAL